MGLGPRSLLYSATMTMMMTMSTMTRAMIIIRYVATEQCHARLQLVLLSTVQAKDKASLECRLDLQTSTGPSPASNLDQQDGSSQVRDSCGC